MAILDDLVGYYKCPVCGYINTITTSYEHITTGITVFDILTRYKTKKELIPIFDNISDEDAYDNILDYSNVCCTECGSVANKITDNNEIKMWLDHFGINNKEQLRDKIDKTKNYNFSSCNICKALTSKPISFRILKKHKEKSVLISFLKNRVITYITICKKCKELIEK